MALIHLSLGELLLHNYRQRTAKLCEYSSDHYLLIRATKVSDDNITTSGRVISEKEVEKHKVY